MPALHIEHAITDLATWRAAFDRFAPQRAAAGVLAERLAQPVDDRHYIVVDLDFSTVPQAQSFLQFLRGQVWAKRENSPGLAGEPHALVVADIA
jgi:hypothetical protein